MSDFINIKMGDNCLQRELEEAGDDWDTLNRLKDRLHINPTGSYPRTPEDVRLIIQQHIDNTSRLFHEVKRKMVSFYSETFYTQRVKTIFHVTQSMFC